MRQMKSGRMSVMRFSGVKRALSGWRADGLFFILAFWQVSTWVFGEGRRPTAEADEAFDTGAILETCVAKTRMTADWWAGRPAHPRAMEGGREWDLRSVKGWVWTHGFWPGILWMAYEACGEAVLRENAELATRHMEAFTRRTARDHDLGFMIMGSMGKAYEATPDDIRGEQMIRAAESLLELVDPDVGTLFSWPMKAARGEYAPYNTIIDSLLNLELFFRASEISGDPKFREAAIRHADRVLGTHVRPDGSSYHLAVFDNETGKVLVRGTHQGWGAESTWARGQAWGIYGFAMCHRETGLARYRAMAREMADWFMRHLPPDGVPYWDFADPAIPDAPRDASAAAIAASGLLILAAGETDSALAMETVATARTLLAALWRHCRSDGANAAFLRHSTGNRPKGLEVDVPLIYADYYFLEALLRLRRWEASGTSVVSGARVPAHDFGSSGGLSLPKEQTHKLPCE